MERFELMQIYGDASESKRIAIREIVALLEFGVINQGFESSEEQVVSSREGAFQMHQGE